MYMSYLLLLQKIDYYFLLQNKHCEIKNFLGLPIDHEGRGDNWLQLFDDNTN